MLYYIQKLEVEEKNNNYCNKKDRKQTINTNLKLTVRDKCDSFKTCWGTGTQIF